jgi:hypothetical protein
MADADSKGRNARIIDEFRANPGNVASYADNVIVLVHHRGRMTGTQRVNPLICQPLERDRAIFATDGGAPARALPRE